MCIPRDGRTNVYCRLTSAATEERYAAAKTERHVAALSLVEDALPTAHTGHTGKHLQERAPNRAKEHCDRDRGRGIPGERRGGVSKRDRGRLTVQLVVQAAPSNHQRHDARTTSDRLRLSRRATRRRAVINAERRARPSPFASVALRAHTRCPATSGRYHCRAWPFDRPRANVARLERPRARPSSLEATGARKQTPPTARRISPINGKETLSKRSILSIPSTRGNFGLASTRSNVTRNCPMEYHPCQKSEIDIFFESYVRYRL